MTEYNAAHIQVLEWPEAVRKRPGMYVGSTGERGLHNAAYDVVEAAANEVLSGRATRVDVTLTADGGLRVGHDGTYPDGLTHALTVPASGYDRDLDRRCIAWGGTCLAATNALSTRLDVREHRDGTTVRHAYARGEQLTPPTGSDPVDGTVITFHLDPEIFEGAALRYHLLADHLRELAFLNRELDITLTDERDTPPRAGRFHHPAGLIDFTTHLGGDPAQTVTVETTDERMGGTLAVALSWTGHGGVHCYANSRPMDGGTQLEGFRAGLAAALNRPDLPTGLTAVLSIKLDRLELEGATRRTLGNTPVHACTAEAVQRAVESWLAEHPQRAAELAGG
ncbi:hypothetical protein GCM10009759_21760 [Kitasatospora saccharophila]|uniref:DNA topoisomerase (ATP-hydrolyzing) n=1 Tax=Kitasatospora saccharophila TaxID=407973 RepID=A0ABP5I5F2_9ACTN